MGLSRCGDLAATGLLDHRVVSDPGGCGWPGKFTGDGAIMLRRTWITRRDGSNRWPSWGWRRRPLRRRCGSSGSKTPRGNRAEHAGPAVWILAFAGMGIQAVLWLPVECGTDLSTRRLSFISTGAAMTILGAVVVREARRLAAVDVSELFDMHRQAAGRGAWASSSSWSF